MTSPDHYSLQVPEWLYPEALSWVAERLRAGTDRPAESASNAEAVEVAGQGRWTRNDIEELHRRFANPRGRAAIGAVARASLRDSDATYTDLLTAARSTVAKDFTPYQLRAQLSWFAKYAKAIKNDGVWPMSFTDRGPEFKGERYLYRMPPLIAEWWLTCESDRG